PRNGAYVTETCMRAGSHERQTQPPQLPVLPPSESVAPWGRLPASRKAASGGPRKIRLPVAVYSVWTVSDRSPVAGGLLPVPASGVQSGVQPDPRTRSRREAASHLGDRPSCRCKPARCRRIVHIRAAG